MATKYILVPEQMYKGLTNIEPENIPLDFERKALSKAKSIKKTPSAKNTLVNQELRRYLKLKKDEENKPVKVELTNGAKGILAPNQNTPPVPSTQNTRTPASSRRPSIASTIRSRNTSIASSEDYHSSAPAFVYTDDDEDPTLMDINFPSASTDLAARDKIQRLYNYITQNPERFGVEGDKIYGRNRKIMPQSDLVTSLERLVKPTTYNMPSPVGTSFLRAAISKDPTARAIYNEAYTPITTKKAPSKRFVQSVKLSPIEKSSGRIQKSKKLNGNCFIPNLWH